MAAEVTASRVKHQCLTWLRRAIGVKSRVNQVWVVSEYVFVIINEPRLMTTSNSFLGKVSDSLRRERWGHEVYCVATQQRFHISETWFFDVEDDSELALLVWRVA